MAQKSSFSFRNRNMSVTEAWEVMHGKFRGLSVKGCCELMALNYGQVYSVRYGDIFKKQLWNGQNFSKHYMGNKDYNSAV